MLTKVLVGLIGRKTGKYNRSKAFMFLDLNVVGVLVMRNQGAFVRIPTLEVDPHRLKIIKDDVRSYRIVSIKTSGGTVEDFLAVNGTYLLNMTMEEFEDLLSPKPAMTWRGKNINDLTESERVAMANDILEGRYF